MKNILFKPLATLLILVFALGCSVDTNESTEPVDLVDFTLDISSQRAGSNCGSNGEIQDGYNVYSIYIEYEPGLTNSEKQVIRAPYCDQIITISPCTLNPNSEIWVIHGKCKFPQMCKPDIVRPTHPNLRDAFFSNTCL